MANVLSKRQEISLFQVLEVPWQSSPSLLMPQDNTVVLNLNVEASSRQARTAILAYLGTYIYPDDDIFNVVTGYLDRWADLGTTTVKVETGAVGEVGGVTMDPEAERAEIKRQICTIIPFYRAHTEIERRGGAGGFCLVPVVR